ncbi:MAG: voltage-gated potassium channel [Oceanospirillaceae bacterium]|jgi:voltage-gated potassium channel
MNSQKIRATISKVIEFNSNAGSFARWVDISLILLITANVLAIILESVSALSAAYKTEFYYFEIFSISIFSLEYIARVWSSPELKQQLYSDDFKGRLRYMMSIPAMIDLIAILPFYLTFFIVIDLRFLRVFRILRIFKLTRYSNAMNTLLKVLKDESSSFFAAFFILTIVLILASSGIYLLEHDIQPEAFGSIPAAMWWATATLTTVGYGDVTPITAMGRIFGGLITIIGMGMVALPAGILASGFSAQLKRNRSLYTSSIASAYGDGTLTNAEKLELKVLQLELGISDQEAEILFNNYHSQMVKHYKRCPHCDHLL